MDLRLSDLRGQFEAAARDARDLTEGLSPTQLGWQPAEKWSIAECLDHLNSAHRILPRFDKIFAEARRRGDSGSEPYRAGLLAALYIRVAEPPVRRLRFRSPKAYRPRAKEELGDAVPRFLDLQEGLVSRLRDAEGLDLTRLRLSSPVTRRFKMSVAEWFAFLAVHQRRHLWQARRVREHPGFPAA